MKLGSLCSAGLIATLLLPGALGCDLLSPKKESPAAVPGGTPAGSSPEKLGALSDFEGEIGVLIKASGPKEKAIPPVNLLIQSNKVRIDLPLDAELTEQLGGKVYVVLNPAEKKLHAVLEGKKQVVLLDLDKAGDQMKGLKSRFAPERGAPEAKGELPKVVKTGKKDRVLGRECEEWEVTQPKKEQGKLVVCIADEGSSWLRMPFTAAMPAEFAWMAELADGKHLPLRAVVFEKGKESMRIELTKLEARKLDAALFEIPKAYPVLSLEEAVQSFMAGAMGRAGLPAGMQLPPGMKLPPGMQIPPGMQLPPGMKLPPGFKLPPGVKLPPGMQAPESAPQ